MSGRLTDGDMNLVQSTRHLAPLGDAKTWKIGTPISPYSNLGLGDLPPNGRDLGVALSTRAVNMIKCLYLIMTLLEIYTLAKCQNNAKKKGKKCSETGSRWANLLVW